MVDDLHDPVLRDIAVAHDQGVGILRVVVLHDQLPVLPADPLLLLPLLRHVLIDGVDTALPALILYQREGIFHPDIAAVPPL